MTDIASKLAGSVRQAKQQQPSNQPATEINQKITAPSPSFVPTNEEPPLPALPSRRVWPD